MVDTGVLEIGTPRFGTNKKFIRFVGLSWGLSSDLGARESAKTSLFQVLDKLNKG